MSKTVRTVRYPAADGTVREEQATEKSRWRADREERVGRKARDSKRIERAERHTDLIEGETQYQLGSTVRVLGRKFHSLLTGEPVVLGSDAAVAVGRFRPDGPIGYRARTMPEAPLRSRREDAEIDEALWRGAGRS